MRFRIYYDDGTTWNGLPEESPRHGCQGVLQWDENPPRGKSHAQRLTGADWYVWRPDLKQWFKCDEWGMLDQVIDHPGVVVRPGRAVGAMAWDVTFKRMMEDPDFQENSVQPWDQRERKYREVE